MNESATERGAGSDEPTGRLNFGRMGPSDGHRGRYVRTGSSCADPIQFCYRESSGSFSISLLPSSSRSQSDRGLDSAERSAAAEPEARGSGKSGAARSDRRETSGGEAVPSAGWREVAERLHAEEGQRHE